MSTSKLEPDETSLRAIGNLPMRANAPKVSRIARRRAIVLSAAQRPSARCSPILRRRLSQNPHEARAHARLRLGQMCVEGGEVGHVGGAREQARELTPGGLRVERRVEA